MNNCCDNTYVDGGTINNPQIINPDIIGGILNNVTMTGGVTLDDATITSLVNQLCPALDSCVLQIVDGAELSNMKLEDTSLTGTLTMDDEVAKAIVNRICAYLDDCVINIVQTNVLEGVELKTPTIINGVVKGTTTLDADAAQSLANGIKQYLSDYIKEVVLDGVLDGIKLANASIDGAALRGNITLDAAARESLANELCSSLTQCIIDAVENNRLTGVELESPNITGMPTLSLDAVEAIGNALKDKIQDAVNEALTSGTLCCLHIEGAEINNSHGQNNTWTDTTLNGTTNINGSLSLDAEAIASLCLQMQPCIDARFIELWNQRGRVVADQVTIVGNGTDEHPLKVNADTDIDPRLLPEVTTETGLPTTIIGDRTQLMGKPDTYVRIGDFIIPAFNG